MTNQAHLQVRDLQFSIEGTPILRGLDFNLEKGEIACLLGPSGCGKTSVLRLIAGFLTPDLGQIICRGKEISRPEMALAPEKRNISMVFQDYALFPHMTVLQNIAFGLKKLSASAREEKIQSLLSLTRLEHLAKRYPHELSGGQQQRVALARSLAISPDILLLDEPFSGLDTELRRHLGQRVRELLKSQGITAIMVTHDQEEAFAVGDQVGVIFEGRLHQWSTPFDLYHKPADPLVADFVGRGCFLSGKVNDTSGNQTSVETELGLLKGQCNKSLSIGSEIRVLLRPDDITLDMEKGHATLIKGKHFMGTNTLYQLELNSGAQIECSLPSHEDFSIGSEIRIKAEAEHLVLFD